MITEKKSRISKFLRLVIGSLFIVCFLLFVVSNTAIAENGLISDPMTIGVGARPLGMGKAYVGVAEDADAIFTNPAGIAGITNPKLTSMYTSLMGEVSYIVVGGAYPINDKSAVGVGIVNSSISDITLTSTSGATTGIGKWSNSVIFLSYGTYANAIPMLKNLDRDILLGANLKYFSSGGDGSTSIANASGSGMSADLAMLVPVTNYMNVGLNYQNALGGQISRTSSTDNVAPTLKLGTQVCLIGREGKSYNPHNNRKLYANIDYDMNSNDRPSVSHLGLEFWPSSNLALRVGSDDSELTAGLGLRFTGIEFNYAYHPYSGISENTTHFFSLGYLGEARKRMLRVKLDSPKDKSIIHEDFVQVKGHIEVDPGDNEQAPSGVVSVKVNGISVLVNKDDLSFSADVPVSKVGKKMLVVEAFDEAGDHVVSQVRLVRLINFADVPSGYWAQGPIENTGTVGLVQGYPDGTFRPDRDLTRAELATILVRAKGLELPNRQARVVFKDVKPDFWAAKYVEVAKMAGLVKGYPDGSFRPNNKISRAEGITVVARFDNLQLGAVEEKPYWDMSADHWAAKYVQAAKDSGMLKFVEKNQLSPKTNMVRSEAIDMFAKTNLADGQIQDLYSWEKGFQQQFIPTPARIIGQVNGEVITASR